MKKWTKYRRLRNQTTGQIIATEVIVLENWVDQLRGVIGRPLPTSVAVCLSPCHWVHTFFVFAPLAVAYCDANGVVLFVGIIPPFRFGPCLPNAVTVWEAANTFSARIQTGDIVRMEGEQ